VAGPRFRFFSFDRGILHLSSNFLYKPLSKIPSTGPCPIFHPTRRDRGVTLNGRQLTPLRVARRDSPKAAKCWSKEPLVPFFPTGNPLTCPSFSQHKNPMPRNLSPPTPDFGTTPPVGSSPCYGVVSFSLRRCLPRVFLPHATIKAILALCGTDITGMSSGTTPRASVLGQSLLLLMPVRNMHSGCQLPPWFPAHPAIVAPDAVVEATLVPCGAGILVMCLITFSTAVWTIPHR
jgi:hypothetical protein